MTVGFERDDPRKREPQVLGEVIRGVLGSGRMRAGMALGRLTRSWDQVVGGGRLAEATAPVGLERGGLRVSATSSAWAAQVTFFADDIRRRANEILGSDEVFSVHVVVDGGGARRH